MTDIEKVASVPASSAEVALAGYEYQLIGKRDLPAISAWFYQCRRDDIHDIYVSIARKYGCLEWDCISTNGNGDREDSSELGKAMFASFRRLAIHDSGKPMYQVSPCVSTVEGLAHSTAFAIADTFFASLFHAARAAPPRSVTQADGQTFGEVAHGI